MLAHLWSNPGAGRTTDERFQKVWIDNRDFVVPMLIFLASSPTLSTSPASGTPRTRVSRKSLHCPLPATGRVVICRTIVVIGDNR